MTYLPKLDSPLSQHSLEPRADSKIRIYRLGDYGLVDLVGRPSDRQQLRRVLMREWATSAAGVILRINDHPSTDDETVRAVLADAAALVRTWAGTPVGLIIERSDLRELVARDQLCSHLILGGDLGDIWHGMWTQGGNANISVELPPTVHAPRVARSVVARACLDWHLNRLVGPATLLTSGLVARSVVQGAADIHLTVSRYQSWVRVLTWDSVPGMANDQSTPVDLVFDVQPAAADPIGPSAAWFTELILDGHHLRWTVARDRQSAWDRNEDTDDALRHLA